MSVESEVIPRYKPYGAYKNSCLEWVGEVPEHWEVIRCKFAANVIMGQSPSSDDYNIEGNGLPFLQGNAEFGYLNPMPKVYCENANKYASEGSILLSVRAPVGALNMADQTYGIGRGLCSLTGNEFLDEKFLYFLIHVTREELRSVSTGSTYDAVSVEDVKEMKILLPDIKEQKSITKFLERKTSKLDEIVQKKQHLIELLQEKRQALITQVLTKGLNPDVKMKDSGIEGIGSIPEHWDIRRLRYMIDKIQTGSTPSSQNEEYFGGEVLWYTPGDFSGRLLLEKSYRTVTLKALEDKEVKMFDEDTILIVCIGATLGKVALIKQVSSSNQQITGLKLKDGLIPEFYTYWLDFMRTYIRSTANYTTLPIINNEFLKELRCVVPPYSEQEEVVNYLGDVARKIDSAIEKISNQIEKIKEKRQALITAAVTGKIDVREEVLA